MSAKWTKGHVIKVRRTDGKRVPLYYYRDKDKKEVGLLIYTDGALYPVACKKTPAPGVDTVRHFAALERLGVPIGPSGTICLAAQALPITEFVQSIPLAAL